MGEVCKRLDEESLAIFTIFDTSGWSGVSAKLHNTDGRFEHAEAAGAYQSGNG